jgi:glycosyltransferase involved in cell wall biosynthesis
VTPDVSVVLAAHNEEALLRSTVGEIVTELSALDASFEVLVVENGSVDATAALADELAAEHPEVRAFHEPVADYGRALRRGLLEATGEYVVNFDVDYYDVGFLSAATELMRLRGADVVIGTKRAPESRDERPFLRRFVTAAFALVLRVGFGLRASDTHGMKALRRARLVPLAEVSVLGKDLFDTELILRAERQGLAVAELPVHVQERRPARSSIVRRMLRTPMGLVRLYGAVGAR